MLLQAGAEILLTVSNGFQAKIIGPAVFMLEDAGMQGDVHIYTINLLEGDYMELAKIEEPKTASTKAPLESIIVKTNDFHLEQLHADTDASLDIIINTTTEGKKTITNHGDDILVKKIVRDSEQKIYAAVGEDQTVLVNGDIELIAEDVEKLVKDITDNHLTIRYDLDEDTAITDDDSDAEIAADAKVVDADAVSALTVLLDADASTKQVIDEDIMASITTSLASSFIAQDIAQIQMYYYDGDDTSFAIAYTNLTRRLQRVAQILNIEIPAMTISHDALGQGSAAAGQILTDLETNYYIAPGATNSLRTIIGALNTLQAQQFGQQPILPTEQPKEEILPTDSLETPVSNDASPGENVQATLDVDSAMSLDNQK